MSISLEHLTEEEKDAILACRQDGTLMQRLRRTGVARYYCAGDMITARNATATYEGTVTGATASTVYVADWNLKFGSGEVMPPSFFIFNNGVQVSQAWILM